MSPVESGFGPNRTHHNKSISANKNISHEVSWVSQVAAWQILLNLEILHIWHSFWNKQSYNFIFLSENLIMKFWVLLSPVLGPTGLIIIKVLAQTKLFRTTLHEYLKNICDKYYRVQRYFTCESIFAKIFSELRKQQRNSTPQMKIFVFVITF